MHNHLDIIEPKLPQFAEMLRLFDPETATSRWMKETILREGIHDKKYPLLNAYSSLYYAILRCQPERSLWQLDSDALALLLDYPLPEGTCVTNIPKLPYYGIYVTIPPTALELEALVQDETGHHRKVEKIPYEGFYFCRDRVSIEGEEREAFTIVPIAYHSTPSRAFFYSITVPMGMARNRKSHLENLRAALWGEFIGGREEILRIALNLLLGLEGAYFEPVEVVTPRRKPGHSWDLVGDTDDEYVTIIKLTKLGREKIGKPEEDEPQGTHASPHGHLRAEHWHSFWVLDPTGMQIREEKRRGNKPSLFRVLRRVKEHKVGEGPVRRPRYLVKK